MAEPLRALFLHPNMPGQYRNLVQEIAARPDSQVVFLTKATPAGTPKGMTTVVYTVPEREDRGIHAYVRPMQDAAYESQAVWRACQALKAKGFEPNIIVGHLGWGQGMYLQDVFPGVPILSFFEFYYGADRGASNYLPGEELSDNDAAKLRTRNAPHLMNLTYSDYGVCPTYFQQIQHPREFWSKTCLLHDGVDTDRASPNASKASLTLESQHGPLTLRPQDEIITYIARNLEPYRGFPTFARAVAPLLKRRPNAQIICIGGDEVSYGRKIPEGTSYRDIMGLEVDITDPRLHFVGRVPYAKLIRLFQITSAHIYLTVPFVLSWSTLEAMACGAPLIASDTAPVREVIADGQNGYLTDFFDHNVLAERVADVVARGADNAEVRRNARRDIVSRYALHNVLPLHVGLIDALANGQGLATALEKIDLFNKVNSLGPYHPRRAEIERRDHPPDGVTEDYIPDIKSRLTSLAKRRASAGRPETAGADASK